MFAEDKALRRPGFAPREWRAAAGAGVTIVEAHAGQQGVAAAVGLPLYGVVRGGIEIGRRLGAPPWATLAVFAVGLYVLLRPADRRRSLMAAVGPVLEVVGDQLHEHAAAQRDASRILEPLMYQPVSPPTPKQMVAATLARAREPLVAREILDSIAWRFGDVAVPTLGEVRGILDREPEFTRPERYRWQLGRPSAPMSAERFHALVVQSG